MKKEIPALSLLEKKELLGMFSGGIKINAKSGEVFLENTKLTRQKKGRKTITEIRHEKEDLGNLYKGES
jgi:hypothetical protein